MSTLLDEPLHQRSRAPAERSVDAIIHRYQSEGALSRSLRSCGKVYGFVHAGPKKVPFANTIARGERRAISGWYPRSVFPETPKNQRQASHRPGGPLM